MKSVPESTESQTRDYMAINEWYFDISLICPHRFRRVKFAANLSIPSSSVYTLYLAIWIHLHLLLFFFIFVTNETSELLYSFDPYILINKMKKMS